MVIAFWGDAQLSANTINGIVKMVPKRSDLIEFLDNWQNLTMLTTTYKLQPLKNSSKMAETSSP